MKLLLRSSDPTEKSPCSESGKNCVTVIVMFGVSLLAASVLGQANLFPEGAPYRSRAEFRKLSSKISYPAEKSQVLSILGPPDAIIKQSGNAGRDMYQYGVDPSTGIPTLDQIPVEDKPIQDNAFRLKFDSRVKPASQQIDERQMRALITTLNRELYYEDPLLVIRSANRLIDLGDKKARYVLWEYEQSQYYNYGSGYRTLLNFLFPFPPAKRKVQDFIREDAGRLIHPDVPITIGGPRFFTYTGPGPSILWHRKAVMRKTRLLPPDDPFAMVRSAKDRDDVLDSLRKLVKGAIATTYHQTFDQVYLQFLRSGAKWSDSLQGYVRKDGTMLPDPPFVIDDGGIHP